MSSADLGTKRICPKCDAKFYDFGAVDPIKCPKCGHSWRDGAKKKAAAKPKKEIKPVAKPTRKLTDEDALLVNDAGLPEVEGDDSLDLEPLDDESVEMTSLEEVEEHEEEDESDPNSDDAEDDMFTDLSGENKIVDDFEEHMEDEEDEDDEDDEADASDEDEDDDEGDEDDSPKKKKRR